MTGKAGEYAVAAQLILRGVDVYVPLSDYGVDLLTGNGCRVQVKSSHMSTTPKMVAEHGPTAYLFPLHRTRSVVSRGKTSARKNLPLLSDSCDVLVLWGINESRFWVVPSNIANETQLLVMGRENRRSFEGNIADVKEMLKLGYKHREIAEKYGVDRTLIYNLLSTDGFQSKGPSASKRARACEGAWENIIEFKRESALVAEPVLLAQEEI